MSSVIIDFNMELSSDLSLIQHGHVNCINILRLEYVQKNKSGEHHHQLFWSNKGCSL